MKLESKVALITGGSRGIGRAVAEAFLEEGAKVVLVARHEEELKKTTQDLSSKGLCYFFPGDVACESSVKNIIQKTLKRLGTVDILINAAAVTGPIGPFHQTNLEEWRKALQIDLLGTVYPIYYLLPHFIGRKQGKIINFSGGGATRARKNFSAYAVAKTAIVRLTEILAEELREFNIQVNAISPGVVKTKMIEDILQAGPKKAGQEYDELVNRGEDEFDSPRLAARLAVFLASDESAGISGKIISARWDKWDNPEVLQRLIKDKDFFVLRRIDGRDFERKER